MIRTPHTLDNLLSLRLWNATLLGYDLRKHGVNLARHVRGVTADVEIGFLQEQLVDFFGVLLEPVLHVDFLGSFAGEGGDEGEFVPEGFFVGLFPL